MRTLCKESTRVIRTLACILSMMLVFNMGLLNVYAADTAELTVSECTVNSGEEAKVVVSISGNTGIWGLKFKVGYNHEAMTLKSVEVGEVFSETEVTLPETLDKEKFVFYGSSEDLDNVTGNGTLITLNFAIDSDAAVKDYPVTVELTQAIDEDGEDVDIDTTDSKIVVTDKSDEEDKDNTGNNGEDDSDKEDTDKEDTDKEETGKDDTDKDKTEDGKEPYTGVDDKVTPILVVLVCAAAVVVFMGTRYYKKGGVSHDA